MKSYYVICYYDPENGYSNDPNFYPSEEEARRHINKDVYSMIECRDYSNEDLFSQIFETFCDHTDCKKYCFYVNCFTKNPSNKMMFETESEQDKLKICATMARQFGERKYDEV